VVQVKAPEKIQDDLLGLHQDRLPLMIVCVDHEASRELRFLHSSPRSLREEAMTAVPSVLPYPLLMVIHSE
jgi:hypothetical protein